MSHALVREGIRQALTVPGFEVVGEAGNGPDGLAAALRLRPDVVVMDITMPGENGIKTAARVRAEVPGTRILMLSVHDHPEYVLDSVKAGAHGYLRKDTLPDDLRRAIRTIHDGGTCFERALSEEVETVTPVLQTNAAQRLDPGRTAISVALEGNPRLLEVEAELQRLEARLGEPEVYNNPKTLERALDAQHKLLVEFESLGGSNYDSRVRELLRGLGLLESDFDKPIGVLSGGQKKLIGLARLLLARPSVLLLDEPDNHLDMPGKAYLEKLILEYPGAVVIVSHDRYLLDAVVTHIVEIEDGRLTTFTGDYSMYVIEKEERLARQEELYQIQQREIGRLQMAIKRYGLWAEHSDKFASRIHAMEARLARVEQLDRPALPRRAKNPSFFWPPISKDSSPWPSPCTVTVKTGRGARP